jgi:SAM-dependent methyltransferase
LTDVSFDVVRCCECGQLITNPRPTSASIGRFYEGGLYEQQESALKKRVVSPLMRFMHLLRFRSVSSIKQGGRLLDVGCGKGKFLDVAATKGWETWGIEPSKRSNKLTENRSGTKIIEGKFEDTNVPDNYFDAVTMWHSLEHFFSPLEVLEQVNRKLKDNGVLVVRVPNSDSWDAKWGRGKWFHLDVPRHLYHFTPSTLTMILRRAGFQPVNISTVSYEDNPIGVLQTLMCLLGFRQGSVFRFIKGDFGDDGETMKKKDLLTAFAAVALAIPSVMIAVMAGLAGHGSTVTIIAKKMPYPN